VLLVLFAVSFSDCLLNSSACADGQELMNVFLVLIVVNAFGSFICLFCVCQRGQEPETCTVMDGYFPPIAIVINGGSLPV
jgi:hypothetical protein